MRDRLRFDLPNPATKTEERSKSAVERTAPRPREAVLKMDPYRPPTGSRRNKLRLDFNENTVGAPPHVLDFLKRYVTAADLSIYPEYEHAMEDLSAHFGVSVDEMTISNGTDEAIQLLVNTYIDDGGEVLIPRPSYAMYRFYAQLAGARIHEIDYLPETFAFPLEELLERITDKTRAVLISNPNNPTGTGISAAAIERILTEASGAVVLIDEAYFEFSGVTVLPLIREYPNLFVSRTFSKIYGMAAMRCGCLFSQAENITYIRKAQSPYSVNAIAAMAARIAVQEREFLENYALEVLAAREMLYIGLEKLQIPYIQSQANFVLFRAGERAIPIRDELRTRGVLVRDRSYELPGWVRVTLGTRDQIKRFLDELEQIWK
jgi:histidinol-phosphate aminotransferase